MSPTQRIIIRSVSVLNFGFAGVGLLFVALDIWRALHTSGQHPAFYPLFWARIVINIALLVLLAVSAKYLWSLRQNGLRFSNVALALELAYIFGSPMLQSWLATYGLAKIDTKLSATQGLGDIVSRCTCERPGGV